MNNIERIFVECLNSKGYVNYKPKKTAFFTLDTSNFNDVRKTRHRNTDYYHLKVHLHSMDNKQINNPRAELQLSSKRDMYYLLIAISKKDLKPFSKTIFKIRLKIVDTLYTRISFSRA